MRLHQRPFLLSRMPPFQRARHPSRSNNFPPPPFQVNARGWVRTSYAPQPLQKYGTYREKSLERCLLTPATTTCTQ